MKKLMLIVTSFLFVSTLQAMELPNKKQPDEHQDTTDYETTENLPMGQIVKKFNFPASPDGGSITITLPVMCRRSFSCNNLKNDGFIQLEYLHAKTCKNRWFLGVYHGTAVMRKSQVNITQPPIQIAPINENDPDFVAQCLPDEQGRFSQLEVQGDKNGSVMCTYLQPVIIQDTPTELPKKYGMPCENKGVLFVKKLYILIKPGETIEEVNQKKQ